MQVRLLGPVGLWHAGRQITVARSHRRCVLAVLAMSAGQVVSPEVLIDRVWGERPPREARHSLYTHVSALRRLLERTGGDAALRRLQGGYVLEIDPDQVDLHRARRYAKEARTVAWDAPDRDGRMVELLREGCALWRGVPLAGLSCDWAVRVREGLEQEWPALVAERFQVELRLGNHAASLGPLASVLADHPLMEPLAGLQILALYRCGRQAEALEVYARTRQRLIDELGDEPGAELRRLHEQVLRRDPALSLVTGPRQEAGAEPGHGQREGRPLSNADEPASAVDDEAADPGSHVPDGQPVPAQLPAAVPDFTGRDEQLSQLRDLLSADRPPAVVIAAIGGGGGIGKTTLAVRAGHLLTGRYTDGQLYANLRGTIGEKVSAADTLEGFLRALGVAAEAVPDTAEQRAALYRSRLADRRVLILLDDATDAAQVRPLLPGSPTCGVLVTSRSRLADLEGTRRIDLDVLAMDEALALLDKIAGPGRVAAEPEAAAQLIRACDGLPLAVRIAGARLAARPIWSLRVLAQRLADQRRRLDELHVGDLAVRAGFELGYRALTPEQARAFRLIATLDCGTVPIAVGTALLDIPAETAEHIMEQLLDSYLLQTTRPGRYELHDLLRLFARERSLEVDTDADRSAALIRVLRSYLASLRNAQHVLWPTQRTSEDQTNGHQGQGFSDSNDAIAWLEAERENLTALIRQASRDGRVPAILLARLIECMRGFLKLGYWDDCEDTARFTLNAAERDGDERAEATGRLVLGSLSEYRRISLGTGIDQLRHGLRLSEKTGDLSIQARALNMLGLAYVRGLLFDQAADTFKQLLELGRRSGDLGIQGAALCNLGFTNNERGRPAQAFSYLEPALELAHRVGDHYLEATVLECLADAYHQTSRFRDADRCRLHCLNLNRRLSDRQEEAHTLLSWAKSNLDRGNPEAALGRGRRALRLTRDMGLHHHAAQCLLTLGKAHSALGAHDNARTCWRKALAGFEEIGAPEAETARALLEPADPG